MATKIEIISVGKDRAVAAFYHTVAVPIAAAADPERTPAGSRLSGAELQALKDGGLFELVKTISLSGMNKAEAKARIEAMWAEREAEANKTYQEIYRDADQAGKAWDGASWS